MVRLPRSEGQAFLEPPRAPLDSWTPQYPEGLVCLAGRTELTGGWQNFLSLVRPAGCCCVWRRTSNALSPSGFLPVLFIHV